MTVIITWIFSWVGWLLALLLFHSNAILLYGKYKQFGILFQLAMVIDMVKIKPHNENYPIGQKCYQTSDMLSAVTLLLHSCMQITEKKAFEL